jgi:hypothetical protein
MYNRVDHLYVLATLIVVQSKIFKGEIVYVFFLRINNKSLLVNSTQGHSIIFLVLSLIYIYCTLQSDVVLVLNCQLTLYLSFSLSLFLYLSLSFSRKY